MEEARGQFTFYASFFDAIELRPKKADRADAYAAVANYALNGIEPDMDALPWSVALVFRQARPTLEAGRKKAAGAKNKEKGEKVRNENR